jgi:Ala-tRNA(Pro) deacylase
MRGDPLIYKILGELNIQFEYYEHPPVPTVQEAEKYWKDLNATHCKNLFFRNHKGDQHYLVILEYRHALQIKDLEKRLRQGKLTFASDQRMKAYLGLEPGSVSVFGLIHDVAKHVHVFIDENIRRSQKISFHPNINTASLVIQFSDLLRFLEWKGNKFEFVELYEQ